MDTQNTINWQEPIEAVHTDGRVAAVRLDPRAANPDKDGTYCITDEPEDCDWYFNADGSPYPDSLPGWTIRNVAPKEVEWGAAIPVDGKRPEWLRDDDKFQWSNSSLTWADWKDQEHTLPHLFFGSAWDRTVSIRLPANHLHYATPTRTALEQRMEDLVRMVAGNNYASLDAQFEARAILAELEPVDGDLLIAREIGIAVARLPELDANEGGYDSHDAVEAALEGIRRGRALERGEADAERMQFESECG